MCRSRPSIGARTGIRTVAALKPVWAR